MAQPANPHLPAIDGLRAVAVAAVLLYHLRASLLPGGFIGVDIFFVISGFVVSLAAPRLGLLALLRSFYARRAVRILPAMLACVLATTMLCVLFVPYSWLSDRIEATGLAAILGYSNVILAAGQGSYFAPRAEFNPFTQTWSLGVEEQFYALFPFLFLPFMAGRRALSRGIYALASLAALAMAWQWSTGQQDAAFYLIIARFWELGLGVLAFQFSAQAQGPAPRGLMALSLLCAAIILAALGITQPQHTPYPGSLAPCLATAVLLWLVRRQALAPSLNRALTLPTMRYLGRVSYSLYLWHWPIFVLARWTCGLETWLPLLAAPALALGAAQLSYRFIETPPRLALATGRLSPGMAVGLGAAALFLGYKLERNLWPLRSFMSLSVVSRNAADWYTALPDTRYQTGCHVRTADVPGLGIVVTRFIPVDCPTGASTQHALLVAGDSHAIAYQGLIEAYVRASGAGALLYQEGGCAILGLKPNEPAVCSHFAAASLADIAARASAGDVVFLPGLRIRRITNQFVFYGEAAARAAMRAEAPWRAENLATTLPQLAAVQRTGAQIILEAPKPVFTAPNYRCADWFTRANPICASAGAIPRATIDDLRAPVLAQFQALQHALPGIRVWDPMPSLCPATTCYANKYTRPLYFDGDHISGYANRLLAPSFMAFVDGRTQ